MAADPLKTLWEAVDKQTGPARSWHLDYLRNHTRRYLADLRLVATLAPEASSCGRWITGTT